MVKQPASWLVALVAAVAIDGTGSIRAAEKCGMKKDGFGDTRQGKRHWRALHAWRHAAP
jgi:RimJ/RimL family protein N-acetyltransferase